MELLPCFLLSSNTGKQLVETSPTTPKKSLHYFSAGLQAGFGGSEPEKYRTVAYLDKSCSTVLPLSTPCIDWSVWIVGGRAVPRGRDARRAIDAGATGSQVSRASAADAG